MCADGEGVGGQGMVLTVEPGCYFIGHLVQRIQLRSPRYAVSGTDIGYSSAQSHWYCRGIFPYETAIHTPATPCPVLKRDTVVPVILTEDGVVRRLAQDVVVRSWEQDIAVLTGDIAVPVGGGVAGRAEGKTPCGGQAAGS
eukprot:3222870-Rhodomonas_salina.1